LALLLACGLRRHEAVALTLDHLQQREEHWAIVDLMGKGGHVRTVPVPDWVRSELEEWLAAAGIDRGRLFRWVNKVGKAWGDGMTVKGGLAHSRLPTRHVSWHKKSSSASSGTTKTEPRTCCTYIRDTIEVFSETLDELQKLFRGAVAPKLHPRRVAELEGAADRLFGKVEDTIREAAHMATGRKLTAERLAETAQAGLKEVFGRKAA
jgi:hypothetical protein